MNTAQGLWWRQAQSDLDVFRQMRRFGAHPCHLLHYLQMATEKLSKAYFWRSGKPPRRSHIGFVRFLKALLDRPGADLRRVANVFGFDRADALDGWVTAIQPLAYELQNLAPAEAGTGPNPEYPWPHDTPRYFPAGFTFPLWASLQDTGRGRKLLIVVQRAITAFDAYA
jgi:hypothetical protein